MTPLPQIADPRRGMLILPWFWELIYHVSFALTRLRLRVVKRRWDLAPSGGGPVIIAAKHASAWDIPLMTQVGRGALGRRVYLQMGSFIGYRVFGPLVPFMKRLGGFCVLRPKEVLRLRKRGRLGREQIQALMERVNAAAEDTRRAVIESGGVLVVYPEGSRNATAVAPMKAERELTTAVELTRSGHDVVVWPVILSYGPQRRFGRRTVIVEGAPPRPLAGKTPGEALAEIEAVFRERWIPPDRVEAEPR